MQQDTATTDDSKGSPSPGTARPFAPSESSSEPSEGAGTSLELRAPDGTLTFWVKSLGLGEWMRALSVDFAGVTDRFRRAILELPPVGPAAFDEFMEQRRRLLGTDLSWMQIGASPPRLHGRQIDMLIVDDPVADALVAFRSTRDVVADQTRKLRDLLKEIVGEGSFESIRAEMRRPSKARLSRERSRQAIHDRQRLARRAGEARPGREVRQPPWCARRVVHQRKAR